jgi:hypothetical protein
MMWRLARWAAVIAVIAVIVFLVYRGFQVQFQHR